MKTFNTKTSLQKTRVWDVTLTLNSAWEEIKEEKALLSSRHDVALGRLAWGKVGWAWKEKKLTSNRGWLSLLSPYQLP